MKWLDRLFCNHSWLLHWIHFPDRAMELRTCGKCGKSEAIRVIQ